MRCHLPIHGLAGISLLLATVASAQETVEQQIRQRVRQYEVAFNAGDVDGLAAVYAPDGTHTFVFGNTARGRSEIASAFSAMLAGPAKGSRLAITVPRVRALSADVAVEESSFSMTGIADAAGKPAAPMTGGCLAIYRQTGGQWYAAAIQCMVPLSGPPGTDGGVAPY